MDSTEQTIGDLAVRLDRLEQQNGRLVRQNGWWKRVAVLALLAGAVAFVARESSVQAQQMKDGRAQATQPLEVSSLIVRDAQGKQRAYLGPIQKGGMRFQIFDAKGRSRFHVTAVDIATMLQLSDDAGSEGVQMLSSVAGGTQVDLFGSSKKANLTLLSKKNSSTLKMGDGNPGTELILDVRDKAPGITLWGGPEDVLWRTPQK